MLAKEIAAELRAKYDLKAACLPVNGCLLRSSIMIRAAPWEVLGTRAAAGGSARGRSSGCVRTPQAPAAQAATLAPRPPFHARVETVTTHSFASRSQWKCCNERRCRLASVDWPGAVRPVLR